MTRLALRMRDHFDGLRELERSIVRGDLDQARERAAAISVERAGNEPPSWAPTSPVATWCARPSARHGS